MEHDKESRRPMAENNIPGGIHLFEKEMPEDSDRS
jgi:hypothetical protein